MVAIFVMAELILLGSLGALVAQSRQEAIRESESKSFSGKLSEVLRTLASTSGLISNGAQGAQDLESIGRSIDKAQFHKTLDRLRSQLAELERLGHKQPEYKTRVTRLVKVLTKVANMSDLALNALEKGHMAELMSVAAIASGHSMVQMKVADDAEQLLKEQREKQVLISKHRTELRNWIEIVLGSALVLDVVLAMLLGMAFVKRISGRLLILSDTTQRLAEGRTLSSAMTEQDEIAQLDHSFREMAVSLAELGRKQRAIIENANDVIFSLDKDLSFVKVSPSSQTLWGYDADKLVGRSLSNLLKGDELGDAQLGDGAGVATDGGGGGHDTHSQNFLDLQKEIKDGKEDFELKIKRSDGTTADMLWSARWSEDDKNIFCVAHDITQRKLTQDLLRESEEQIKAMLNNILAGLMIVSSDGKIEYCNDRLAQLLQFDSKELTIKSVIDLFPKIGNDSAEHFLLDVRSRGAGHIVEQEIKRRDEALVPVELSITELETNEGSRLLISLVDITERRQIERTRQEFVAMISHDLRTPLASVGGFLELLSEGIYGDLSDDARTGAQIAFENVENLLRLINDLLEITKLESGKIELQKDLQWLSRLTQHSVENVSYKAGQAQIEIVHDLPQQIQIAVDRARLCRVIENILLHIIKSSPQGGSIKVSGTESNDEVVINISAHHVEYSPERCKTIFDRYRRSANLEEKPILSLAICRAVIEQLDGKIGVNSEDGKGSMFWIHLSKHNPLESIPISQGTSNS